jgi:hypothetical protein
VGQDAGSQTNDLSCRWAIDRKLDHNLETSVGRPERITERRSEKKHCRRVVDMRQRLRVVSGEGGGRTCGCAIPRTMLNLVVAHLSMLKLFGVNSVSVQVSSKTRSPAQCYSVSVSRSLCTLLTNACLVCPTCSNMLRVSAVPPGYYTRHIPRNPSRQSLTVD